jgi:adenine-specific DNA-methyltransferase
VWLVSPDGAIPDGPSREELTEELEHLRRENHRLKQDGSLPYGLFWREEYDNVLEAARERMPVLREDPSLSFGDDDASTVLIEGDNFHALMALSYTHHRAFDVIYIDPPYNTGNQDFVYNDRFVNSDDEFRHSKWLSFMAPRLALAKDLLSPGGLIFISISDHEVAPLTLLCDDISGGPERRIGPFVWFYEGVNDNNAFVRKTHEHILCYQPKPDKASLARNLHDPNVQLGESIDNSVVKNGSKNPPSAVTLPEGFPCAFEGTVPKSRVRALSVDDDFVSRDGKLVNPVVVTSGWSSKNILLQFIAGGFAPIIDSKGQQTTFYLKKSGNLHYRKVRDQSYLISVLRGLGTTADASEQLAAMGLKFTYPKPVDLIKFLVRMHACADASVLDFFAGSGTTGQAVAELNAEDGGSRRVILVTNNEGGEEDPTQGIARRICHERLRRLSEGYTDNKGRAVPGLGFALRYFRAEPTVKRRGSHDAMKRAFRLYCGDLLKLRENTFTPLREERGFALYASTEHLTAVLYRLSSEAELLAAIEAVRDERSVALYAFSLDDDLSGDRFVAALGESVRLSGVPKELLDTYLALFQRRLYGAWRETR